MIATLRTAALPYTRSHAVSGFITTPKSCSSTWSRTNSGRAAGLGMGSLLLDLALGEEHRMDAVREPAPARVDAIGPVAVELGLHLPGMRGEQQDAVADAHGLGDGVRDEEHGEARALPELQQLVLHLAACEGVQRG